MENKIQQLKSENRNNEEYISQMSSEIQQNCVCIHYYDWIISKILYQTFILGELCKRIK